MSFLYNAWYCCGFPQDFAAERLRALRILNEPVVLMRQEDGRFAALQDRCPHRFAPLSRGRLVENTLQCGYHGLRFDASGACVFNPHGTGVPPKAAKVKSYPLLERHGALWIWMGQAELADPALLPDFSEVDERPGWKRTQGYLHIAANYQLVADNLLDLSHAQYLHPFFFDMSTPPPPGFHINTWVEQQGESVTHFSEISYAPNTALFKMLWERGTPPAHVLLRGNMRWHPPSLLSIDTGASPMGGSRDDGPTLFNPHWLTPETETSTHYFWAVSRDRYLEDAEMHDRLTKGIGAAFVTEDEPMIEACQLTMGTTDFGSLNPVLLSTDGAATRARRILEQRIRAETGAAAAKTA